MSIGSMPAAASVASDIISVALADLSSVLMTSPGAPYAARPEHRPAVADLLPKRRELLPHDVGRADLSSKRGLAQHDVEVQRAASRVENTLPLYPEVDEAVARPDWLVGEHDVGDGPRVGPNLEQPGDEDRLVGTDAARHTLVLDVALGVGVGIIAGLVTAVFLGLR
jgi:hypothetical protein